MKRSFVLLLLLTIPFFAGGQSDDSVRKEYAVDPGKTVFVDFNGTDGNLEIRTHDRDQVIFEFKKEIIGSASKRNREYFAGITPEVDFSKNRLTVSIRRPKRRIRVGIVWPLKLRVNSVIWMPAKGDVRVRLDDGDLSIAGVSGDLDVRTDDGALEIRDCSGSIKLESEDGDVQAEKLEGDIRFDSDDGNIRIDRYSGRLNISCEDGEVRVHQGRGSLNIKTSDGDATANGVFDRLDFSTDDGEGEFHFEEGSQLADNCFLKSGDGNIRLYFHSSMAFAVKVRTDDGRINSDVEMKVVDLGSRRRFEGSRGDGSYLITIHTGDGDVFLKNE